MTGAMRRALLEGLAPTAVVEDVAPQVDGGRFAVKRVVGEEIVVEASAFAHGHEKVAVALRFPGPDDASWIEVTMEALRNDPSRAAFRADPLGEGSYFRA